MQLSSEGLAVLAHIVIDPDAWVDHALKKGGEQAVIAKINRWKPEYLAQKDLPDYKNRAERDIEEEAALHAALQLTPEQIAAKEREVLIQAKMREMAEAELIKAGLLTA